jgi:hypothetical protein
MECLQSPRRKGARTQGLGYCLKDSAKTSSAVQDAADGSGMDSRWITSRRSKQSGMRVEICI